MNGLWNWIKREWLAVVIVVGVVLGLYFAIIGGAQRDRNDRDATVAGCIRGSERTALDAAFQLEASKARRDDGNDSRADYYEGIADGMLLTIPAPSAELRGSRVLMEVRKVHVAGRERYVLTPQAKRLHMAGCERAYRVA